MTCTCIPERGLVCLTCQTKGVPGPCWCRNCFDIAELLGENDRQHIESCDCDCHSTQEDYVGLGVGHA